jgi:hypothetical protein
LSSIECKKLGQQSELRPRPVWQHAKLSEAW